MASVTGMTVAAINVELDKMIVSISVDEGTGEMFAHPRSGDPISAGPAISPQIAVEAAWPVGSIYINADGATNPHDLLGVGTWARYGKGRTIVSLDEAQAEFDSLGETGGEKTHTLTVPEMPSHTHTQSQHRHTPASRTYFGAYDATVSGETIGAIGGSGWDILQSTGSVGPESVTGYTTAVNQNTGGGLAHNVLSPYIVAYIWRRTS